MILYQRSSKISSLFWQGQWRQFVSDTEPQEKWPCVPYQQIPSVSSRVLRSSLLRFLSLRSLLKMPLMLRHRQSLLNWWASKDEFFCNFSVCDIVFYWYWESDSAKGFFFFLHFCDMCKKQNIHFILFYIFELSQWIVV